MNKYKNIKDLIVPNLIKVKSKFKDAHSNKNSSCIIVNASLYEYETILDL